MPVTITTNVQSVMAQNNLQLTTDRINKSLQRLSSGNRIASSQDDPAGMAISERLKAQIRSYQTSWRNAQDGQSALQVAEGAMSTIGDILIRMRELTMQASNDTLSADDRLFLNQEIQELKKEIDRIASSTKFNGNVLLSGGFSNNGFVLQIGIDDSASDRMTIVLNNIAAAALGSVGTTTISSISVASSSGMARDMLKYIDAAIDDVSRARANVGAQLSRLGNTLTALSTSIMTLTSAKARITDADVAVETANLTSNQILAQAGSAVLSQANNAPQIALALLNNI